MKIALIGYGKMGQLIERLAKQKGHTITAVLSRPHELNDAAKLTGIQQADVCIDFSHPESVLDNVRALCKLKKNIVMGTTGWKIHQDEITHLVKTAQIGFIHSPNFSIGIALFTAIVNDAAKIISRFDQYDVGGVEVHHNQKVDAPSGTAVMLADLVNQHKFSHPLTFSSVRVGDVPGTHSLLFDSTVDTITLTHTARNKEGFALGAITAAEWLQNKSGVYTLSDLFT